MEFRINQKELLRSSNLTDNIVDTKSVLEIMKCVRIEAAGNRVEFRSTSGGRVVIATVPAKVAEPGTVVVESEVLNKIVKRLPDDVEVSFSTRNPDDPVSAEERSGPDMSDVVAVAEEAARQLRVRAGRAKFAVSLMDAEEFPGPPVNQFDGSFELSGADLKLLLDKTYRSSPSSDSERYYLQGIYLHPAVVQGERRLTAVACDSYRLSRMSLPAPEGADGFPGVIIPTDIVSTLRSCVADDDELRISAATEDDKPRLLRVASDQYTIISQVLDATYPVYARLIPDGCDIRLEFERRALTTCISRVAAIAGSEGSRVNFNVADGVARLSIRSRTGQSEDQIAAVYQGPEVQFILEERFILDAIAQIDGDSVVVYMRDSRTAVQITEESGDGVMLAVIMPHRA